MPVKSTLQLESKLIAQGYEFIIGIDEAGRGPLAGPVVASAVILKNLEPEALSHADFDLVRDSKTLSARQREKIFDFIYENFYVGIGVIDQRTIDRVNILEATFLAMKAALSDLKKKLRYDEHKHIIVVDGNKKISNISIFQQAVPSGDKLVKSISAASIVAKVTRDRIMLEMHALYPEYAFDKHKGYGTKLHLAALQRLGPCFIHRASFAPVARILKE